MRHQIRLVIATALPAMATITHAGTASNAYHGGYLVGIVIGLIVWLIVLKKLMDKGSAWSKALAAVIVLIGLWSGYRAVERSASATGALANTGDSESRSEFDLRNLAASVKPGDVTIYTTTDCPHSRAAKAWMSQHGFAYIECDVQARPACASQLQALGGDGVPFLRVRGQSMKDGFDSDQFTALLRQ